MKKAIILIGVVSVFFVIVSIILVGVGNNKEGIEKFDIKPNDIVFSKTKEGGPVIKVYISKENKIKEIGLEDYVRGVVAAEMPAEFELEALKAQAVAARTYALAHMEDFGGTSYKKVEGANVSDTVDCQVYMSKEERLSKWPESKKGVYWNKITKAVEETLGEVITYDGEIISDPYYFSTSSGKTESSVEVLGVDKPYLRSVKSEGEEEAPKYKTQVKISNNNFINKINSSYSKSVSTKTNIKNQVKILERSESGTVKKIKLGKNTVAGTNFRKIFSLSSSKFTITFNSKEVIVDCKGYGHNLGMSQWGARAMAKKSKKYTEIIEHYYNKSKVKKINWEKSLRVES